jgi:hypothetical protein
VGTFAGLSVKSILPEKPPLNQYPNRISVRTAKPRGKREKTKKKHPGKTTPEKLLMAYE